MFFVLVGFFLVGLFVGFICGVISVVALAFALRRR